MATLKDYEQRQRLLVSQAGSAILDAMITFTAQHGELTGWEWCKAFRAAEDRIMAEELRDEWKREPG